VCRAYGSQLSTSLNPLNRQEELLRLESELQVAKSLPAGGGGEGAPGSAAAADEACAAKPLRPHSPESPLESSEEPPPPETRGDSNLERLQRLMVTSLEVRRPWRRKRLYGASIFFPVLVYGIAMMMASSFGCAIAVRN